MKFINLAEGHTVGRHFHNPLSHWDAQPRKSGWHLLFIAQGSVGGGGSGDSISFQALRDLWHLGHCRCHPAGWLCDSGAKRHLTLVLPACHVLPATRGMKVCPPPRLTIEPGRWLSIHAGRCRSALGRSCSGDVTSNNHKRVCTPKCSGIPSSAPDSECRVPGAAERGGDEAGWQAERVYLR